ncbi:MAG: hypothetical protein P1T08_05525 [Acidimicrobiia bacterium]|nr:hypothetical protein [Acidimicrobiia bacterium]
MSVTWDHNPESDLDHYNVYFSDLPGGPYAFLRIVSPGDSAHSPGRAGFIDFERDLTVGKTCYRISAVDAGGSEGAWSTEACFDA